MANIPANIEKGVEIGAPDALKWLSGATHAVVAALATLVGREAAVGAGRRSCQPPEHPSGCPDGC